MGQEGGASVSPAHLGGFDWELDSMLNGSIAIVVGASAEEFDAFHTFYFPKGWFCFIVKASSNAWHFAKLMDG